MSALKLRKLKFHKLFWRKVEKDTSGVYKLVDSQK